MSKISEKFGRICGRRKIGRERAKFKLLRLRVFAEIAKSLKFDETRKWFVPFPWRVVSEWKDQSSNLDLNLKI